MHKAILISALIVMSSGAIANPIVETVIKRDIYRLSEDTSNEKLIGKVRGHVLKEDLDNVMRAWSISPKQSVNPEQWGEIGINILHWAYPDTEHRWLTGLSIPEVQSTIYQQDSLIDLDKIKYEQGLFKLNRDEMFGYDVADITSAEGVDPKLNKDLLRHGLAPIGPDNQPIKVCTLGRSSAAPYLELSATQLENYRIDTGLDFSRCLYGLTESAYWVSREADLIDEYHDLKPAHSPKGSWRK